MLKTSKKISNWLGFAFLAFTALILGIILKIGLSTVYVSVTGDTIAQAQQNEMLPEKISTATPSVSQKPQYLPESQSQQAQGIKFIASNFNVNDSHVFTDVCYDLPGNDVWDINMATLEYDGKSTSDFAVSEFFIDVAKDNKSKGSRCLKLDFYNVDPNSDFSSLKLVIGNLGQIAPSEGHECEGYLGRIKANTKISELGIKVSCEQLLNGSQVKITGKPDGMTDEDANVLVSQVIYGQVDGPWEFTVIVNK